MSKSTTRLRVVQRCFTTHGRTTLRFSSQLANIKFFLEDFKNYNNTNRIFTPGSVTCILGRDNRELNISFSAFFLSFAVWLLISSDFPKFELSAKAKGNFEKCFMSEIHKYVCVGAQITTIDHFLTPAYLKCKISPHLVRKIERRSENIVIVFWQKQIVIVKKQKRFVSFSHSKNAPIPFRSLGVRKKTCAVGL